MRESPPPTPPVGKSEVSLARLLLRRFGRYEDIGARTKDTPPPDVVTNRPPGIRECDDGDDTFTASFSDKLRSEESKGGLSSIHVAGISPNLNKSSFARVLYSRELVPDGVI